MRRVSIGLFTTVLILVSASCQNTEALPTSVAAQVSPEPTPRIGVDFVTVTPSRREARQSSADERPTSVPPTETATPTRFLYSVQAGDTLVGIAAANGASLQELLDLNPDVRPEMLLVGQEIILPPRPEAERPVSSATDVPVQLEIIGLAAYESAGGGTWVLGEVRNYGPDAAELVQVQVALRSVEGTSLVSDVLWLTPVTIPASTRAPFGVLFPDMSLEGTVFEAEVVAGQRVYDLGNRLLDLAVVDTEVTIGRNPVRVSGYVENRGQSPAGQVSIVTTFYDTQEVVTGLHEQVLDEIIMPGERLPFEFIALPPGGRADAVEFAFQATIVD